jgi:hypothetical protein
VSSTVFAYYYLNFVLQSLISSVEGDTSLNLNQYCNHQKLLNYSFDVENCYEDMDKNFQKMRLIPDGYTPDVGIYLITSHYSNWSFFFPSIAGIILIISGLVIGKTFK